MDEYYGTSKVAFHGCDPSTPSCFLDGAEGPFYLTNELKQALCNQFNCTQSRMVLYTKDGSILPPSGLLQGHVCTGLCCSDLAQEYWVGQLVLNILDCPPTEITTSWKLKPRVTLQGRYQPKELF